MERRDFIKLCSATGLSVVAASTLSGREAQAEEYKGQLFISISQGGGWDVTSVCDPKGAPNSAAAEANAPIDTMNRFLESEIPSNSTTGVRWAPLSLSRDLVGNQGAIDEALKMENFFETWSGKMLVINGVDHQTNSHDVGARLSVTGNAAENTAAFGAVAAAALLPTAPMGFVGFGGYTGTAGLTSVTRLGNTEVIKRLAYPYRRDPNDPEALYFTDAAAAKIAKAREDRFNAKMKLQRLPKLRTAMNTLYLSRLGQNELKRLVDFLPSDEELLPDLAGAIQLVTAAYRAGLCVAASLSTGGWDTHGNSDTGVADAAGRLFDPEGGLPRGLTVLEDAGILNKTLVTLMSDFGRTPGYNMGNGKDHWPISSVIVLGGVDGKAIKPGVKGATNDRHEVKEVDPVTGVAKDGTGMTIKPAHVINSLRRIAGILDSEAVRQQQTTSPDTELTELITT